MLDNLATELRQEPALHSLLARILAMDVCVLLTACQPVGASVTGAAEKVIELAPLSHDDTARLFCKVSPRALYHSELPGASDHTSFIRQLARTQLVHMLSGNPGRVKEIAPRLLSPTSLTLRELEESLTVEATAAAVAAAAAGVSSPMCSWWSAVVAACRRCGVQ